MTPEQKIEAVIDRFGIRNPNNILSFEKFHEPNNWAAHGTTLKKYCGIPIEHTLHFAITHGQIMPQLLNTLSPAEKRSTLPLLAVNSKFCIPMAEEQGNCLAFSIGSINGYADYTVNSEQKDIIKSSLGKHLLVYPHHTTPDGYFDTNYEDFLAEIAKHSHQFDSITFCIYWVDLLKKSDWVLQTAEFGNITTNGHTCSLNFQENIKTNMNLADVVLFSAHSSGIHYAFQEQRRVWIYPLDYVGSSHNPAEKRDIDHHQNNNFDARFATFFKKMGLTRFPDSFTPVKYPHEVSGCDDLLSAEELRNIEALSVELLQLGFRSEPGVKEKLRKLAQQSGQLSEKSNYTLRTLLEKSDLAVLQAKDFEEKCNVFFNEPAPTPQRKTMRISTLSGTQKLPVLTNIKVDLCCGERKPDGFIGVDCYPGKQVDIVHDLNSGFPFEDSVAEYVRAHDAIEHLREPLKTMNEIWRICKNGAIVDIKVPSTDGRGAFQDPTHVSFWNENSFMYYTVDHPDYLAHGKIYGFKGAFKILEQQSVDCGMKVIQLYVRLQAIKPAP